MSKKLLKAVLGVQTASRSTERMNAFIQEFCEARGMTVREDNGNLYVTKGQAAVYPCIVAHTDTVHRIIGGDKFRVYEDEGVFFGWDQGTWTQAGVGGDDKCGVYIALSLLDELPACKAAFFRDEEIGCLGAAKADFTFFDDCAFALQADRRGADDVVVEACGDVLTSDEFNVAMGKSMTKYGKAFCRHGAMTDVQDLKSSGLGICAINASAGYHAPHTDREVVVIAEVMNTRRFFRDLCLRMGHKRWEHTTPKRRSWSQSRYDWEYGGDWVTGKYKNGTWKPDKASLADRMKARVEKEGVVQSGVGRHYEIIDGFMTLVLDSLDVLEGGACPACFQSQLYWDYAEKEVWCNHCGNYSLVIVISEEEPELLALPGGG